jgi:hypothetical protein
MSTAFANEFIPYNVSQLSGIQLWLDAADSTSLTLSGSTVTAWRDKSGLSNDATINNSVTFNASDKSVRTDGTNGYFTSPLDTRKTTSTYYNVFLVYKWLSSSSNTNQSLWGNDVGGGWNRFQLLSFPSSTGIAYGLSRGATSPNTTNISALNTSNTLLYSANYAYNITNGSYAYVNGSQSINFTEVAASPETSTQLIFFGQLGSDQYFASIAFHEIIVARLEISNQTRQAIEGYLAWKWGLQNSLPSTHPYSLSPFYAFPPFPITNKVPKTTNRQVFLPTQISGCMLWLDGADPSNTGTPPANGSSISTWTDKSGNGNNATSVNNPTYNLTTYGVDFTSSSFQYFTLPDGSFPFNDSSYSYFYIFTPKSVLSGQTLTFGGSNNGTVGDFGKSCGLRTGDAGTGTLQAYWFSYDLQTTTTYTTNVKNFAATYYTSGSTRSIWINFTQGASDTPGVTRTQRSTLNTIGVVRDAGGPIGDYLNAQMHEIIVYNSALNTTQRQQIEGYLAWKWGLQANLSSTHPYKQAPTYTLPPFPSVPAVVRGTAKAYDPTRISGVSCQTWLDASDLSSITFTSGKVSKWNDKSGNDRYASASSAVNYALYQNRSVYFPPYQAGVIDSVLSFNNKITSVTSYDLFVVSKPHTQATTSTWRTLIKGTQNIGEHVILISSTGTQVGLFGSAGFVQFGSLTIDGSSRVLLYVSINGSNQYSASLNGSLTLSSAASGYSESIDTIGNALSGQGQPWGEVNEFIAFNSNLNTTTRQAIEGYLMWKWGLQGSLPQTHPWKLFPPPPN